MDKSIILEKLRTIKPDLRVKYGVSELALFGSYSRDEQTAKSDIDIMVDFDKPVGIEFLDVVYRLKEAFDKLEVQVVSKNGIRAEYFNRLKQDLLYA